MSHINQLFDEFNIESEFRNEFRALVEEGTPPSARLGVRLARAANYQACLGQILAELSQPTIDKHFSAMECVA